MFSYSKLLAVGVMAFKKNSFLVLLECLYILSHVSRREHVNWNLR